MVWRQLSVSVCLFFQVVRRTNLVVLRKYTMAPPPWLSQPPSWPVAAHKSLLLAEKNLQPPPDLTLTQLVEQSAKFPIDFPVETVRCHHLKEEVPIDLLERNINSAYPVIHEHALHLCARFLAHQQQHGNTAFYRNMTLVQFVDRLLSKRAVCFVGRSDNYLLLNKAKGAGKWSTIGTPREQPPLILADCLSYDEIKLSALLSVSSFSYFINDGSRINFGKYDGGGSVQRSGVIVGLIGARLERENVMEFNEVMKTSEQNTVENGYGAQQPTVEGVFLDFYADTDATYEAQEAALKADRDRYVDLGGGYFDKVMFERRMALSIDTLLLEANDRARRADKRAFVHVVGLGLGVWKICEEQDRIFMDTFAKRIEVLKDVLTDISDVRFAYIKHNKMGDCQDGDTFHGITVHIENKNPHEKLEGDNADKLLVVSYAWDGNALPGNEFWFGKSQLAASGDPAAAASSQIAELHNFHINPKVRGCNLRVATLNGLVTFEEYQKLHKDD